LCTLGPHSAVSIGFADKSVSLNRTIGSTPKAYALKADGRLHSGGSSGESICTKLAIGDIIGCCLDFIAREIFFTKNGVMLQPSLHNVEAKEYFPSVSLSSINESVTFKFSEFSFDIAHYKQQEADKQAAGVQLVPVYSASLHQIVHYYLAYYGYTDTLKAFDSSAKLDNLDLLPPGNSRVRKVSLKLAETLSMVEQPGKCGICLNDSATATCRDCARHLIGTIETSKTRLALHSSEMSRRSACLSDDQPMELCSSVDLSSVYMKELAIDLPTPEDPSDYYANLAKVQRRGEVRRLIMNGETPAALEMLLGHFPQLASSKALFAMYVQHFIELVRSQDLLAALKYAREALAPIRSYSVLCRKEVDEPISVAEITGLLCYVCPYNSSLSFLMTLHQRELTADVMNAAMIESEGEQISYSLSRLLQHYLTTLQAFRFTCPLELDLNY
jgi:hypothetical protein